MSENCVLVTDPLLAKIFTNFANQYGISFDVISNQDLGLEQQQILDETTFSNLLSSDVLCRYERVITINFPTVVYEYNTMQQLIEIDFDTQQLVILNREQFNIEYFPIMNVIFESQKLSLQFEQPIKFEEGAQLNLTSFKFSADQEKEEDPFFYLQLQTNEQQALEIHEFQVEFELKNFQYRNGGYVRSQSLNKQRISTQLYYNNEDMVFLLVFYKIISCKATHQFEKYFLKQYDQIETKHITIDNQDQLQTLDVMEANRTIVYNRSHQKILPPTENFQIINLSSNDQFEIMINQPFQDVYLQYCDKYLSCQVVSHPHNVQQCYLKSYEIVKYITNNQFKTEFLDLQERNLINLLRFYDVSTLLTGLCQYYFEYIPELQIKSCTFSGLNHEPQLQDGFSSGVQMLFGGLNADYLQKDLFELFKLLKTDVLMSNDELQKVSLQFDQISNPTTISKAQQLQIVFYLTIIRAMVYRVEYDEHVLVQWLQPEHTSQMLQIVNDLEEQLMKNPVYLTYGIVISSVLQCFDISSASKIQSRIFGKFYEGQCLDLYEIENQIIIKNGLGRKISIKTVRNILDLFKNEYHIELTLLITESGKLLYMGAGGEDVEIHKWYVKNGEGNNYFGILRGDNDDGEELPNIRIWWGK